MNSSQSSTFILLFRWCTLNLSRHGWAWAGIEQWDLWRNPCWAPIATRFSVGCFLLMIISLQCCCHFQWIYVEEIDINESWNEVMLLISSIQIPSICHSRPWCQANSHQYFIYISKISIVESCSIATLYLFGHPQLTCYSTYTKLMIFHDCKYVLDSWHIAERTLLSIIKYSYGYARQHFIVKIIQA